MLQLSASVTEEQIKRPSVSELYQIAHFDTHVSAWAAMCSNGNLPDSHEFVDVSEGSDDATMKSNCE